MLHLQNGDATFSIFVCKIREFTLAKNRILPDKTSYRPTSPILKEDLRKADEICAQARYMERKGVSSMKDLLADREEISSELKELSAARTKIYNKMRRAKPEEWSSVKLTDSLFEGKLCPA